MELLNFKNGGLGDVCMLFLYASFSIILMPSHKCSLRVLALVVMHSGFLSNVAFYCSLRTAFSNRVASPTLVLNMVHFF